MRVRTTGSEKRHLTVMLAVSSAGDILTPMIIFKGKRPLEDISPRGCVVRVQEKACVDESLMIEWIRVCYRPFTQRQPSMLVMDSFRAHLTDKVKKINKESRRKSSYYLGWLYTSATATRCDCE